MKLDIRILVSEDTQYKFESIEKLLKHHYPYCIIVRKESINETIRALACRDEEEPFDVLIQDMQLPLMADKFDPWPRTERDGGIQVIDYFEEREQLPPIICFCSAGDYPNEQTTIKTREFELPLAKHSSMYSDWKTTLVDLIGPSQAVPSIAASICIETYSKQESWDAMSIYKPYDEKNVPFEDRPRSPLNKKNEFGYVKRKNR